MTTVRTSCLVGGGSAFLTSTTIVASVGAVVSVNLVLLCAFVSTFFISGLWTVVPYAVRTRSAGHLATAVTCAACLAVVVSVPITNWPVRVAFQMSRQSLEELATEIDGGGVRPEAGWRGAFYVARAEREHNGIVCLWLSVGGAGNTGFVRCARQVAPRRFNLFSLESMDEDWQLIWED
jgi:hypothetical protein